MQNKQVRNIRLVTYNSIDDLNQIDICWNNFINTAKSDIYFTTDWIKSWWRYYGNKRIIRLIVCKNGDKLVAALPFCIEEIGLGPGRVRLAKFMGADSTIPVFFTAIELGWHAEVLQVVLKDLLYGQKCDAVSFSPLSAACPLGAAAKAICKEHLDFTLARCDSFAPHTTFELPNHFEAYLASLAKQARSNYRRDLRNLAKMGNITQHVYKGKDVINCYNRFVDLHTRQWRDSGHLGHFGDWPDSAEFNRELVERLGHKGQVRFHELAVDGETISLQFGFVLGDRYYWRLPARRVGEPWDKAGLGRLALVKMIEALIDEGVRWIEAGPGHYDYKVKHGGAEYPLTRLIVGRRRLGSRIRTRVLLLASDLCHFVYYRLWFIKLAPKLGLSPRPLWRLWIRTRL